MTTTFLRLSSITSAAVKWIRYTQTGTAVLGEPLKPSICGTVPGSKSKQMKVEMDSCHQAASVKIFIDYEKSKEIISLMQMAMFFLMSTCKLLHYRLATAVSRPALGSFPPTFFTNAIKNSLISIAPKGCAGVQNVLCGSSSNENAIKAAFMWYQAQKRGGSPPTKEDLDSCMKHELPGTPNLSVLSFNGSFHGRTLTALSITHSKPIHKVDLPAFRWPVAEFPRYKYPLEKNVAYNEQQDQKCLANVSRTTDKKWNEMKHDVAALIVEPIQGEGGDNHGSPAFFKVQTGGGGTGTFWAHDSWNLSSPPDIIVFAKKLMVSGYFYAKHLQMKEPLRIYNTWLGDPTKVILLEKALQVIKEITCWNKHEKLGKNCKSANSSIIRNVRGLGTFCAFDMPDTATRDKFLEIAGNNGLFVGGCGSATVRFRPALIFGEKHLEIALDIITKSLSKL
ncbi:4-aminobutyrate aminotransferase, mitochondrial [Dirofilaria immitis]|nr:4-aminobutyrate aminotransferase, mitochondrial [Dirofilaria immitis]